MGHTLIKWSLARKWTLSYATPQCVGMLLAFYIIQVKWPFDFGSMFDGLCQSDKWASFYLGVPPGAHSRQHLPDNAFICMPVSSEEEYA